MLAGLETPKTRHVPLSSLSLSLSIHWVLITANNIQYNTHTALADDI